MSKATVQFVEMVRKAVSDNHNVLRIPRHCEACGKVTDHISTISGEWERLTCPCGVHRSYRVK